MKFKLRDYQIEALNALHESIKTKRIALLSAATGAGKTVIICRMIAKYMKKFPRRNFLVLAHKKELLTQFHNTFLNCTDVAEDELGFCCSGISKKYDLEKRVVLASVQTLAHKIGEYSGADMIIIDETHRAGHEDSDNQYQKVLDRLQQYKNNCRIIGVSATVYRLGHGMIYGKKCRPGRTNFFPELTYSVSYKRLCKEGYLMPLRGKTAAGGEVLQELNGVKLSGGEFVMAAAGEMMGKHVESAVDAWEEFGSSHQKVAVLACTIEHALELEEAFLKRGYKANVVHSNLKKSEREKALNDWQFGEVTFCISVNILVEGFDFPALSCLVMCRPTKSPVVWVQAIGRILRMCKGKDEALIIDMTGNIGTFGLDLDNPHFIIPKNPDGEGECPQKVCPGKRDNGDACGAILHAACRICPECGYQFTEEETAEVLGDMKDVEFKQLEPPKWFEVIELNPVVHLSQNSGKELIKINIKLVGGAYERDRYVSVWVCLPDYYSDSNYAIEQGQEKWEMFSDQPYPDDVNEAAFFFDTLKEPVRVLCEENDKGYLEAVDFDFTGVDDEQDDPDPIKKVSEFGELPEFDVPF